MFNFFSGPDVDEIKPSRLEERISSGEEFLILDVRSSSEFSHGSIEPENGEVLNYPSKELLNGLPEEVEKNLSEQDIVVVCYKGNISRKVAGELNESLENTVMSLEKGMTGWRKN